jgi:hypothetical protein
LNEKYIKKLIKIANTQKALSELENVIFKDKRLMLDILKGNIQLPEYYSIQIVEYIRENQIKKKNDSFFIKEYFKRTQNKNFNDNLQKHNITND